MSSNCLLVFICVVDKIFCGSSLKDSEVKFLYSLYKIWQGLFLSNDVFNTVRTNLWKSDSPLCAYCSGILNMCIFGC